MLNEPIPVGEVGGEGGGTGDRKMAQRPRTGQRPVGRRIQARFFRVTNVPVRRILGLPFATPLSGRLMLLHLTGRRTGRSYRQPVSYVRDGTTLLTPGGGNWKLNLVDGQPVPVRLRGQDRTVRPELVRDREAIEELLGVMIRANPMVGRFVGMRRGPDSRFDPRALDRAVAHGFVIVRWHLDDGAERRGEPA